MTRTCNHCRTDVVDGICRCTDPELFRTEPMTAGQIKQARSTYFAAWQTHRGGSTASRETLAAQAGVSVKAICDNWPAIAGAG